MFVYFLLLIRIYKYPDNDNNIKYNSGNECGGCSVRIVGELLSSGSIECILFRI